MTKPRKNRKPPSELQKVCMQYGRDVFRIQNTRQLAEYLEEQGYPSIALSVTNAYRAAGQLAKTKYFKERKKLQPAWKDWDQQVLENLAKWEVGSVSNG